MWAILRKPAVSLVSGRVTKTEGYLELALKWTRLCSSASSPIIGENSNLFICEDLVLKEEEEVHQMPTGTHFEVPRCLPKTPKEYMERRRLPVIQPDNPKLLKVAIVGMPNAGKSTLINQLIGVRISAVSSKVHTTRRNVVGVLVEDNAQVEFWDTPGLVTSQHCMKHRLEQTFMSHPLASALTADTVLIVVDVSNKRERAKLNPGLIQILRRHKDKESILVLNKVDVLGEKRKLVDIATRLTEGVVGGVKSFKAPKRIEPSLKSQLEQMFEKTEKRLKEKGYLFELEKEAKEGEKVKEERKELIVEPLLQDRVGWPEFSRVFMVSAITGDGIEDIRQCLVDSAKPNPWKYNGAIVSPQDPAQLVAQTVREKFLDNLRQEIPYLITFKIQTWEVTRLGTMIICMEVLVPKDRYMAMVLGPGGKTISRIVDEVRQDLANSFHCDVSLKLIVKCTERGIKKFKRVDKKPKE